MASNVVTTPSVSQLSKCQGIDIREIFQAVLQHIDPKDRQDFEEWAKTATKFRFMVTGPSGVGKSTLLNGIIGETVFKVGRRNLAPVTTSVCEHQYEKDGVTITVLDCPGLHDGTENEESYLQQMQEKYKAHNGVDLILYCRRMDKVKADVDCDAAIIEKLTASLGKEIWECTLFVLTFANVYEKVLNKQGQDVNLMFKRRIELWKQIIEEALRRCSVDYHVEVCPAGKSGLELCGNPNWLSDLWASAFEVQKVNESGALAFLRLAKDRMETSPESCIPPSSPKPLEKQPIVLTDKVKKALGLLGGGGAGAGAGAVVGATIGAVCIGVISFGPAAGAGLVIGGVVGAAVGSAISGAVLKLYEHRKAKKEQPLESNS